MAAVPAAWAIDPRVNAAWHHGTNSCGRSGQCAPQSSSDATGKLAPCRSTSPSVRYRPWCSHWVQAMVSMVVLAATSPNRMSIGTVKLENGGRTRLIPGASLSSRATNRQPSQQRVPNEMSGRSAGAALFCCRDHVAARRTASSAQLSEHFEATHPLVKKPFCVPVYVPVFCPGNDAQLATSMTTVKLAARRQRE